MIKITADQLTIGMFVAELDRPWIDTPFLIQGFLIQDEDDLNRLRAYCKFVFVDPLRSAAGVLPSASSGTGENFRAPAARNPGNEGLRKTSLQPPATPGRDNQKRPMEWSERDSDQGRRFAAMVRDSERIGTPPSQGMDDGQASSISLMDSMSGLMGRLFGALRSDSSRQAENNSPVADEEDDVTEPVRHDFLPPSVDLVVHKPTRAITEELAPAQQAFGRAQEVVLQMVQDIRGGKPLVLDRIEAVVQDVVDSMLRNPDALMWVARLKQQHQALYGQGLQAAVYLISLGRYLGLPKEHLARLGMAGTLLDVGKTKLPRTLLGKRGELTADEFALLKEHVPIGLKLLQDTPNLHPEVLEAIAQHHEREDGSGYPNGLPGVRISLFGRMAALIDSFVALTNERSYAVAVSPYQALRKLSEWSATLFHAPLVEQFIQAIGVFPVGSLVELSTGEVAMVIRQSKVRRLKPRVLVVSGPDKSPLQIPSQLDLLHQPITEKAKPVFIMRGLPAGAFGVDNRGFAVDTQ